MDKQFYVYIITNFANTVLYTGMTNDLSRRIAQHKSGSEKGFSYRYNTRKLVYFEVFRDPCRAIVREKQIKAGSRRKKIALIETFNPSWRDLKDSGRYKPSALAATHVQIARPAKGGTRSRPLLRGRTSG